MGLFVLLICGACVGTDIKLPDFKAIEHPCEKVSNATSCVWYDDSDYALLVSAFQDMKFEDLNGEDLSACIKLIVSHVCINIDFEEVGDFFTNVTISITLDGVVLWSDTTTLPELKEDGGLCLDDNTVLEILLLIPETRNATEWLVKALEWTGCEPKGIFSLCFYFEPCSPEPEFCGCFTMDFQLLYWHNWCLYKSDTNLGCINDTQTVENYNIIEPPRTNRPLGLGRNKHF